MRFLFLFYKTYSSVSIPSFQFHGAVFREPKLTFLKNGAFHLTVTYVAVKLIKAVEVFSFLLKPASLVRALGNNSCVLPENLLVHVRLRKSTLSRTLYTVLSKGIGV